MNARPLSPPLPLRAPRKYLAIFGAQLSNDLAYPVDAASRSVAIVLFMWVFAHLWSATYGALGQATIAGLSYHQTLWHLLLAEMITLSQPRISTAIAEAVKDGSIAYLLAKPYNFLLYQVSAGLGDSVVRLACNGLIGGAIVWWLAGPPPDPRGWPAALVAVALGMLINFASSALIGLSAFVAEDVAAFEWIYSKALFLLGGLLIPLDFYPDWLRAVATHLPFAYVLYGPARLFVTPSLGRFFGLLLGQAAWLLALGALLAFCYGRAVRRLTVNGG
jgi:ABC-2 type transport system permease protein